MASGYSGTPLAKKLGIKQGFNILLYNAPDNYFDLFDEMPKVNVLDTIDEASVEFIHLFFKSTADLKANIIKYKMALKKDGILWVSWPKGSSKIETDINREIVRDNLLSIGLVDIKVAAIDEDWSGLKFMYRKKDR